MKHADPVAILQDLIRCPSVTPHEGGAMPILKNFYLKLAFNVTVWFLQKKTRLILIIFLRGLERHRRIYVLQATPMLCQQAMKTCGRMNLLQQTFLMAKFMVAVPQT